MVYDFDKVVDRRNTRSTKWDKAAELGFDVVPLWLADMDFLCPPQIGEAIAKRVQHGIFGYEEKPAIVYETVAQWILDRYGWKVHKEEILPVTGVIYALNAAIRALTIPGDEIIVQTPAYHPFFDAVTLNGRSVLENPLKMENGRYEFDLQNLREIISDRTRGLILCNPHNPSGRSWSCAELAAVGEICLENGIAILSDEIHCDLVHNGGKHIPIASLSKELAAITITFISPTKTFNIAGLKIAAAVAQNSHMRERFRGIAKSAGVLSVNTLGVTALEAAYGKCSGWVEQINSYIARNMEYSFDFFNNILELPMSMPDATYFAWVDFNPLGLEVPCRYLIRHAGILSGDGADFGMVGRGFLRFNVACPRQCLEKYLSKIETAIRFAGKKA